MKQFFKMIGELVLNAELKMWVDDTKVQSSIVKESDAPAAGGMWVPIILLVLHLLL